MPGSDAYGDSDDDALLEAATQHADTQQIDDFEGSPRPAKRARTEGSFNQTTSDLELSEENFLGDDTLLEAEEIHEERSPNKRERQLHAPRINADLSRVILDQTQAVPQSQPWEIRGPVWKRPKPPTPKKATSNGIASYFGGQQKVMPPPPNAGPSKSLAQIIATSNKDASRAE